MNLIRNTLLNLLIINTITCVGQNKDFFEYYNLINQAEVQHAVGNYYIADSLYKKAFVLYNNKGFAYNYLQATKNAIIIKSNYLDYLLKGFENGLLYKIVKKDTIYNYLKKNKNTKYLKKQYKKIRSEYLASLNSSLRDTIAKMVKEDQKYRKGRYERMDFKKQKIFLNKVDTKNYNKLLKICQKYGFPGRDLVGDDGNEIGFVDVPLLLRHLDSAKLMILKPYILKAIKNGTFDPLNYAFAYDYINMFKTTVEDLDKNGNHILIIQQQYGVIQRTENGKTFIFPVESIEKANNLRAKIGLPTLEDNALILKLEPPTEGIYKRIFK